MASLADYTDPIPEVIETIEVLMETRLENWVDNGIYKYDDGCRRAECCRKKAIARIFM